MLVALLARGRDPFDSAAFWLLGYPLATAVACHLGHVHPHRSWGWALLVFEALLFAQFLVRRDPGNLWPLAMIAMAIASLPAGCAAWLAARRSPHRE